MRDISIFQLILLSVFGVFVIVGIIVVSVYGAKGGASQTQSISMTVWGTLDRQQMQRVISKGLSGRQLLKVNYVEKSEKTFDDDLVQAVATGSGPDIVLFRLDSLLSDLPLIVPIPYDLYPARDFNDTFIEEGRLFLSSTGALAIPFTVDPLVMYWNRDLLSREGFGTPPRFWDEVFSVVPKLTKKDSNGTITQSAIGLGEYGNVKHAKDILAAMILQSGNKIVSWNRDLTSTNVDLQESDSLAPSVLSFYTQFSNAQKPVYTWNRALVDSQSMFLSNRLALYIGFASEARDIRAKSPNLNFDVVSLPQSRTGNVTGTLGRLYGFAILKSSSVSGASMVEAIKLLTSAISNQEWISASGFPPVRKDVKVSSGDAFQAVFSQSALVSRGWLDPNPAQSDVIFKDMIESVVSGFTSASSAVSTAAQQLRYYSPRQ
ncbi:MAG: hypothetical protein A2664_04215 [Candidatus Taylorbacteria bacterium RIFCSPHIGHO2_01_FULL_46_22b]|uniref:ABC transporter substrate-binding protein n=1 Tax=Candidatus Taylorbacteria bacterium RIFCSPHIGHO2_01_FULL_46_22b TaxID=1802301 RepID=A0A1G2M413_9BACT|nr:MAG: hypothetical protein A2664_04215 [Candidatus Taylorbacteria bacterium RIFCSPHIGHO2_01_FULL_46_22b]